MTEITQVRGPAFEVSGIIIFLFCWVRLGTYASVAMEFQDFFPLLAGLRERVAGNQQSTKQMYGNDCIPVTCLQDFYNHKYHQSRWGFLQLGSPPMIQVIRLVLFHPWSNMGYPQVRKPPTYVLVKPSIFIGGPFESPPVICPSLSFIKSETLSCHLVGCYLPLLFEFGDYTNP